MSYSKQISDHLRKRLECPICLDVKRGCNIFQCKNGHIACEECYKKLRSCPSRRFALTKAGIRNLLMEKLIVNLPLECQHLETGCSFETTEGNEDLRNHESKCLFRPVPCPHTACDRKVPLAQLESHVISQHKAGRMERSGDGMIIVEWPPNFDFPEMHWRLTIVSHNGILFFPMLLKRDNTYYGWTPLGCTRCLKRTQSGTWKAWLNSCN
jgi:hypothetical protein